MADDPSARDVPVQVRLGRNAADVPLVPLRVLAIADLTARSEVSAAQTVTKDTLPELLASLAPRVTYEVTNHLGAPPARLDVDLTVATLRAFEPHTVAAQVPGLRELVELRAAVSAVREGRADIGVLEQLPESPLVARFREHFRASRIAAPPPQGPLLATLPTASPSGSQPVGLPPRSEPTASGPAALTPGRSPSLLDAILDGADLPGAGVSRGRLVDAVDELARTLGSTTQGKDLDPRRAQEGLAALDGALGTQLDAVLHAAPFAALESAWRGLRFLVSRTDFRAPIQLEVISAPLDRAAAALAAAADADAAPALVLAAYALGPSVAHADIAAQLAHAAETLQAPVVIGLDPSFFGIPSWSDSQALPALPELLERPQYTAWRALRRKDSAYWLACTAGQFFARPPYDMQTGAAFPYREAARTGGVWCSAVWAVGAAVLRSFAHGSGGLDITGAGHGLIEDLPLHDAPAGPTPFEPALLSPRTTQLDEIGVIPFRVHRGDAICMASAAVVRQPRRYSDSAATAAAAQQATLQHSLLAGRIAAFIGALRDRIGGSSAQELARLLEAQLCEFLGSGTIAHVQVADDADHPSRYTVSVRVSPPGVILGRPVQISFSLGLPR